MSSNMITIIIVGGATGIFLLPFLIGYFGFGTPTQHHPFLKKALFGIALLQLSILGYCGWLFMVVNTRHVNHLKWFAPLMFVDLLMWICFGIGFGGAALRYHFRTKKRP